MSAVNQANFYVTVPPLVSSFLLMPFSFWETAKKTHGIFCYSYIEENKFQFTVSAKESLETFQQEVKEKIDGFTTIIQDPTTKKAQELYQAYRDDFDLYLLLVRPTEQEKNEIISKLKTSNAI